MNGALAIALFLHGRRFVQLGERQVWLVGMYVAK